MRFDAKTLTVIGSIITALGTASAGVIQAAKSNANNDALFRNYRVEQVILNAKLDVLMNKTGVKLDVDVDAIRKSLTDPVKTSWQLIPSAYAQEPAPPVVPVPVISVMIDGCNCVCPEPPVQVTTSLPPPAPTDQEVFKKAVRARLEKAPRSIEDLE